MSTTWAKLSNLYDEEVMASLSPSLVGTYRAVVVARSYRL